MSHTHRIISHFAGKRPKGLPERCGTKRGQIGFYSRSAPLPAHLRVETAVPLCHDPECTCDDCNDPQLAPGMEHPHELHIVGNEQEPNPLLAEVERARQHFGPGCSVSSPYQVETLTGYGQGAEVSDADPVVLEINRMLGTQYLVPRKVVEVGDGREISGDGPPLS